METLTNRKKGFTLVEMMIVVALVALLATLAIPQMIRSRINANEVAAVGNMRTLYQSCLGYYNIRVPRGYPDSLTDMAAPNLDPPFISNSLANATSAATAIQGYYYVYTVGANNESFTIIAWPVRFGRTGAKNFFLEETGRVTFTNTENNEPHAGDPPVTY